MKLRNSIIVNFIAGLLLSSVVYACDPDRTEAGIKVRFTSLHKTYYSKDETPKDFVGMRKELESMLPDAPPGSQIRGKILYILGNMDFKGIGTSLSTLSPMISAEEKFKEAFECNLRKVNKLRIMYCLTLLKFQRICTEEKLVDRTQDRGNKFLDIRKNLNIILNDNSPDEENKAFARSLLGQIDYQESPIFKDNLPISLDLLNERFEVIRSMHNNAGDNPPLRILMRYDLESLIAQAPTTFENRGTALLMLGEMYYKRNAMDPRVAEDALIHRRAEGIFRQASECNLDGEEKVRLLCRLTEFDFLKLAFTKSSSINLSKKTHKFAKIYANIEEILSNPFLTEELESYARNLRSRVEFQDEEKRNSEFSRKRIELQNIIKTLKDPKQKVQAELDLAILLFERVGLQSKHHNEDKKSFLKVVKDKNLLHNVT